MMALRLLPIIQVIVILCSPTILCIPIYGTKRYGQSLTPYRTMVRTTRYPVNNYEHYPSSYNYPDEYFTQDGFPLYYPATSKYEVYQAVLPYYYQERPQNRYGYNYYGLDDPVIDLQEEMIQKAEREQREEAQPIGHEIMYETEYDDREDDDDTKVAFLKNLIISQMYNDQEKEREREKLYYDTYNYDPYGDDVNYEKAMEISENKDKDVDDLKKLVKYENDNKQRYRNKNQNEYVPNWYKTQSNKKVPIYNNEAKRDNLNKENNNKQREIKMNTDRKPILKFTTVEPPQTKRSTETEGQKEIVMMRPATPVRNPFSNQVLQMMSESDNKKKSGSVYDTIKKMLDMEKNLEQQKQLEELRPTMKKRIISSEDSLIKQLTVLKKAV